MERSETEGSLKAGADLLEEAKRSRNDSSVGKEESMNLSNTNKDAENKALRKIWFCY